MRFDAIRLLGIPILLLGALVACDGSVSTGSPESGDTADQGWTTPDDTTPWSDTGTPSVQTSGFGTQIGSEGFWDCEIETIEPILDITADLPDLGGSPQALVTDRIGDWVLQLTDPITTDVTPGAVRLGDVGEYAWVDVQDGPGCADHLAVEIVGDLSVAAAGPVPVAGWIAIRPGEGKVLLTEETSTTELQDLWRPPVFGDTPTLRFRLEGSLDVAAIAGEAVWEDCTSDPCPTTDVLATVIGTR